MDKATRLEKIAKEIEKCGTCKKEKSGKAVPGEGNPEASIVFIGEAPGKTEAKTGRPFVGRSGKFLRSLIREIGQKVEDVFITSPVKYLPDRGTPSSSDIAHGRIHLQKQLSIIDPKIIVLLGSVAIQGVLDRKIPITKQHGTVIEKNPSTSSGQVRKYFITLHPSAALRFPPIKKLFVEDFRRLKSLISLEKLTV
jgi:DNA polymerase